MAFLILAIIGWGVGLFAFSNILLPLFWAYPKVRKLGLPVSAVRFVAPAAIWSVLLLISLALVGAIGSTDGTGGYLVGLGLSFLQIGRLVGSPNQDMEADFADSYGRR